MPQNPFFEMASRLMITFLNTKFFLGLSIVKKAEEVKSCRCKSRRDPLAADAVGLGKDTDIGNGRYEIILIFSDFAGF